MDTYYCKLQTSGPTAKDGNPEEQQRGVLPARAGAGYVAVKYGKGNGYTSINKFLFHFIKITL